jgi:hypothetical protein
MLPVRATSHDVGELSAKQSFVAAEGINSGDLPISRDPRFFSSALACFET